MSVVLNVAPDGATIAQSASAFTVISAKTQFLDQVKINSNSQLISGIFKLLQKLVKYFRGITSFTFVHESSFRIRRKRITWFISIIPQASCGFSIIFTVFT